MNVVLFYHSLLSDWNHGNAHFLRGYAWELKARGHEVAIYEPANSWSLTNLLQESGTKAIEAFRSAYPGLESIQYDTAGLDLDRVLSRADLVIVHEWNDHDLVRKLGAHRKRRGKYQLLFHDTHHRSVTDPQSMAAYDLSGYDGVLAYGAAIAGIYLARGWSRRAWTWHEAADIRIFRPRPVSPPEGDLVWIGNWGDEERSAEIREFLIEPVKALKLRARIHGVRYPQEARRALEEAGIEYGGWLPNFRVPEIFSRFRVTIHIQRRPYTRRLPGIPTIRPFEAMACGIPLVCSPWKDTENLFTSGADYLIARDGAEMVSHLRRILSEGENANALAAHALQTIRSRHNCAHRVDQLLEIYGELTGSYREETREVAGETQ
jgi:spore maturation protein CgeB